MPPPYSRRTVWSWAFYDFANSAFTTLIVTFVYATYFTQAMTPDEVTGTALWSRGVGATALLVALLSPVLGALADRGGVRKRFLMGTTAICVLGTAALFWLGPGQAVLALIVFVVANVAFEMGGVFYNAYLPEIAPPERIGRVSGYGWALGYVGGLLCLVVALFLLIQPDPAPFGLDRAAGEHVRATNLLVAGWFALFAIPAFLFLREAPPASDARLGHLARDSFAELRRTFRELRRYRHAFRLLLARLFYNDGLVTIFAFGGIYAAGSFGFTQEEILYFGIALNVAAGLGAFGFGFVDDRLGGRFTIFVSLAILAGASLLAVMATTKAMLWAAGVLIGIAAGPNQAASRSLLGRFAPPDKETEFYGFYAFSGKATAFMGPLLLGVLTDAFDSQRAGIASVLLFFVVGAAILTRVDERAGAAVRAADAA